MRAPYYRSCGVRCWRINGEPAYQIYLGCSPRGWRVHCFSRLSNGDWLHTAKPEISRHSARKLLEVAE
jgi:hypothetical protein